jgi:hypothetical protein
VNAIDETLPNSIKREHPRKGEKKKQGARTKVQAGKPPKRRNWIISIARYGALDSGTFIVDLR